MFTIWFQEVGEQASEEMLAIFATLVPGFPAPASQQTAPRPARSHPEHNKHGEKGPISGPLEETPSVALTSVSFHRDYLLKE